VGGERAGDGEIGANQRLKHVSSRRAQFSPVIRFTAVNDTVSF
jgi:hypothetical protein